MIPKIIHYCWLSGDTIPENLQRCMESWKKFLPDYEFMLWDRNRFDINSTIWTKQAFKAKKYAFAADYIRLYAVYHYGGIYMDMDIEVLKNLDKLLYYPYILSLEDNNNIEAGVFGMEKNSPFLQKCLEYYKNRVFIKNDGNYDTRTLPSIMYEVLSRNYKIEHRKKIEIPFKETDVFYLYTHEYFTAKSYKTGEIKVTKNTFTIHHFAGSWISKWDITKGELYKLISSNIFTNCIYNVIIKPLKVFVYKLTRLFHLKML